MKGEPENLPRTAKLSPHSQADSKCIASQSYRYQGCLNGSQGRFLLYRMVAFRRIPASRCVCLAIIALIDTAMGLILSGKFCQQSFNFSIQAEKFDTHASGSEGICRTVQIGPDYNSLELERMFDSRKSEH